MARHTKRQPAEKLPLKMNYRLDAFLMYCIQQTSKLSTAELLAFFYDLGTQISQEGMEKRTGSGIRKELDDYFPGTSIPFHMLVKGHESRSAWNEKTNKYDSAKTFNCTVEIGFPEKSTYMDEKALAEIQNFNIEKIMFGAEVAPIAPFDRPATRTPKMYLKLMEEVRNRRLGGDSS